MTAKEHRPRALSGTTILLLAILTTLGLILAASTFLASTTATWVKQDLSWLFAADSVQVWWYVTRAAGFIAYLLLWLSVAWGLAVPAKLLDRVVQRWATFDFHQFISLLAVGFMFLHILVLMLDHYLPFTAAQILIPFIAPYRPLWVGIGIIAFYLILLVTVTYYIRARIGMRTFRAIHVFSLLAYLGATFHGLYAGTDSPLLAVQLLYEVTGLTVVFLTVYWLVILFQNRRERRLAEAATMTMKKPPMPSHTYRHSRTR
jgi:sulfoxide reductase heme-binding subunit YedZ